MRTEEVLSKSQHVRHPRREDKPSVAPPPVVVAQELKRKHSATMPGSLFPRSASLEPEPTPAPLQKISDRHVHFTPRVAEDPQVNLSTLPLPSIAEESRAIHGEDDDNPFLSQRRTPAQIDRITSNSQDAKRFLEDHDPSPRSSPTPVSPTISRLAPPKRLLFVTSSDGKPSPPAMSAKAKGKQRVVDTEDEYEVGDTSQVLRVNGKVRELRRAREEQWQKEQERCDDPETSIILEEREKDKERIVQLEAEVAALRSQVSFEISIYAHLLKV